MIKLEKEEILWESKNKKLLLTTHRLRQMEKSILGSTIKSIMLEKITSCELKSIKDFQLIRKAVSTFLLINGSVYLLNQYLFKAELMKLLFGEVHIGGETAALIFYISIFVSAIFLVLFLFSFKKVFTFSSPTMAINFQLRWLSFDERESFISKVEEAKDKRLKGA